MAKLKNIPIGESDLVEYLDTASDFAFELRCLERLSGMGFQCEHGGSYTDPVTKKTRQFDIRARKCDGRICVWCAVECKCLSESFPLLVMCVPRLREESFHDLILSYDPELVEQDQPFVPALAKTCEAVRAAHPSSEYVCGEPVGKSCAQVGRADHDHSIVANDAEVFEKWSQALASLGDLADRAAEHGEAQHNIALSLILPVVVVPDGTLWKVDYEENGARKNNPTRAERCSFCVGHTYAPRFPVGQTTVVVSHLEFVTFSGLHGLMDGMTRLPNSWFPENARAHMRGRYSRDRSDSRGR